VLGFNAYPTEIEKNMNLYPVVLECAAIGAPNSRSSEAIKLFVVKRDSTLSEEDLVRYCRDDLTAYERPNVIEFHDGLPKSKVGKILQLALRTAFDETWQQRHSKKAKSPTT
jgi:long-chain acyl-CoA synthetase